MSRDDLMPHERKKLVTAEPLTSREKNEKHDIYCAPCRVWYSKEKKACPNCGKSLLLG